MIFTHALTERRGFGPWLVTLAVALSELAASGSAQARQDEKTVLVLYSTGREAPMSIAGDRQLPPALERGYGQRVTVLTEYIDMGRFPEGGYQDALRAFLRVKYQARQPDVIIAIQAAAIDFITNHRDTVFPGTPVVFLAIVPPARRLPNSTGIIQELDLARTIALAMELQPGLKNVFVVSGAGVPDKGYERQAREQLRPFASRLAITYLSGLPTRDLDERLAKLPPDSIVYYLVVYQDGAGETFSPLEYLDRVSAIANAPTYSWVDNAIGHGIVGGSLLDANAMMDAGAQLAVRILRGERADSIPTAAPNLHVSQVDWRQLRRWNISEARVPAETRILFEAHSLWERYRVQIIAAITLVVLQTALIVGLLIQRTERRQAEEQMRASEAALRASYDRIRDLGGRLLGAQETERSRIARELHDDISQQIALLEIDLELLGGALQGSGTKLAGEVQTRARGIARSVHDLSHRLHPAKLRLIGLVAALQGLQREMSATELPITFTHADVPPGLPPDLTLCLFRVAQEALQNAVKYSDARRVTVDLRGAPDGLSMTIADDGVGFDVTAETGKGIGLLSMNERIESIGGTLGIRSIPGAGTRLEVRVPLAWGRETVAV